MTEFAIWRVSDRDSRPCAQAYQKPGDEHWYVRLDTLQALLDLVDEVGDIIVNQYSRAGDLTELTILDARLE